ncbi:MAG: PAS domain S-box protein [Methanoregulaceae archaeon]|nr:PAS domain S-box protein [Methanoregulaceae archaeon]
MYHILYVDDENAFLDIAKLYLERSGEFTVDTAGSATQALKMLRKNEYDAIISDYQMPGLDGIEFLRKVRGEGTSIPFLIFTGRGREEIVIQALNEGADFYIQKGWEPRSQFAELQHKLMQAIGRKKAEQALRVSETRFRELAELLPQIVFEFDEHFMLTYVNQHAYSIMRYDPDEVARGYNVFEGIEPSQHQRMKENMARLIRGEPIVHEEYTMIRKDGTRFPALIYAYPLFQDKQFIGFRGVIVDTSPLKRTEEYGKILVQLLDSAPEAITVNDLEGRYLYANQRALELYGYSRDEFLNLRVGHLITENDQKIREKFDRIRGTGEFSLEENHIQKDGSTIPLQVISKMADWGGQKVILSIASDITDRREMEHALRESEGKIHTIVESSPIPQFVIDNDHRIILWNKALEEMSGIPSREMHHTDHQWRAFYMYERPCLADLLVDNRIEDLELYYPGKFSRSKFIENVYEAVDFFPHLGTHGRWLHFTASVIRDTGGEVIGATETLEDITDRIDTEKALLQTNKKLHLLSDITRHDILNQMTVLLGYLDLLKEENMELGKPTECVLRIEESANHIRRQIEFTREYQDIGITSPTWQNLEKSLRKVLQNFNIPDVSVGIELEGLEVYADPLLERVFYNIIDNALKHGKRVTEISFRSAETENGMCISISDNGIGVPVQDKKNIFERGFGHNSGFGLFLTREILDITDISIVENGIEGEGARFELIVPRGHYREYR